VKIVLRVIGAILLLSFLGAVGKNIAGGNSHDPVIHLGKTAITIPGDTRPNVLAVTRALLEQTAYEPWYQHCVVQQAGKNMSRLEFEEFSNYSAEEKQRIGLRLMAEGVPACERERRGRDVVNPNASHSDLALLKWETAKSTKLLFLKDGKIKNSEARCFSRQLGQMTDAQTLTLANSQEKVQEAIFEELFAACV
jgi:hypothetical protein